MHIALCHNALIPPPKYGGTERIVYWLAKALLALGHKVTLIAGDGSAVPGADFVLHRDGVSIDELVPSNADLIHMWTTPAAPPRSKPFLVTIQGNGQQGETFHPNTLFISKRHAENHGARHFVYNGIDADDYVCEPKRGDYAVFLAKASWSVKNLDGAIAVARAAGLRLEVLGSRDWPLGLHRWRPTLRGVRYRGMVDDREKREVLSRARALLFPVRWHEPFGIAMTEALASGCPVIGTPYGSLPEIVSPEVGVLSADGTELVRALSGAGRFAPQRCRARVLEGFSHLDMARSYLRYYESVLATGSIAKGEAPSAPRTTPGCEGLSSKSLLPWRSP